MAIYRRDIRQVAKKFEEKLTDLLWMCSREELQQFIIGYAKEQPDIHDALQNFLLPDVGSTGYPDYKKRVTQLLKAGQDDRGFRKGADDGLTSIVDELNRMIWKAERYAGKRQYKEALGITLTVMEQIALSVDNIYDHDGELVYTCNEAESVVEEIIKGDIPDALLETIVPRLKELREIDTFEAYGLADIDFLLLSASLKTSDADTALNLLSNAIKEENNPYRCTEMVKTMLRILEKEGRTKEYRQIVDKYSFLPDIMRMRFEWLAEKNDWTGILKMLDKNMALAEQEHRRGDVINLKESKLEVYQLMNDTENVREMATELFYTGREPMVQYHLLKKTVPENEWPDFLDRLLSNSKNYPGRSVNAEIFIEERQWEKLMDWVWEHTRLSSSYDSAEPYEKYLVKHRPERLLDMYRLRLINYAYGHTGREHYRLIAKTMQRLQNYPGGEALVKELAEVFHTYYRNRPAMMEELKLFIVSGKVRRR